MMHSIFSSAVRFRGKVLVLLLLLAPAGCTYLEREPGYYEASSREVSRFVRDMDSSSQGLAGWSDLSGAVLKSIEYVAVKKPGDPALDRQDLSLTWGDLHRTLIELYALLPRLDRDPDLLQEHFVWLELTPDPLLTGYFEPFVEASLEPHPDYPYPVYGPPEDLLQADLGQFHPRWKGETLVYTVKNGKIRPYFQRNDIDFKGALQGRGLEIAWAKNLHDLFFLQIQGSGKLVLPDGSVKSILYSGKNGHQYVSLGRIMLQRGLLSPDDVSMQSIRRTLEQHPELVPELLSTNPSYVFFRLEDEGPFGSMNKLLTPFVSVASDRKLLPLGAVTAMATELPIREGEPPRPLQGIFLPQDTGGAIQGHRLDLFCGLGEDAEFVAGHLKADSKIYLLLHKSVVPPK